VGSPVVGPRAGVAGVSFSRWANREGVAVGESLDGGDGGCGIGLLPRDVPRQRCEGFWVRWKGFGVMGEVLGKCLAERKEKKAKRESAQVLSLAFSQIQCDPDIKR
jgi:hypothetical protein